MNQVLRFPLWYYGGPYQRVSNPDSDLPHRDPSVPISPDFRARTEFEGNLQGERLLAPFHDSNSVEDILTELSIATEYPHSWSDEERFVYPTIQGSLAQAVLRLETKLKHEPGRVRASGFTLALNHIHQAAALFAGRNYESARAALQKAHDLIEQCNRATRRKVSFVVGPDGVARKV